MNIITSLLLGILLLPFGALAATDIDQQDLLDARPDIIDYIRGRRPAFQAAIAEEVEEEVLRNDQYPDISEYSYDPTTLEQELIESFNVERKKHGAQDVVFHSLLVGAANRHADDMVRNNFFSHDGSDDTTPEDRVVDSGYTTSCQCNYKFGEILADGATSASHAIQLWLESPPHRAILLDPLYTHVGIKKQGQYWVAVFGVLTLP